MGQPGTLNEAASGVREPAKPCTTCYWRKGGDEFAKCRAPAFTQPAHVSGLLGPTYADPYCTGVREISSSDRYCGPEGKWWAKRQWWRP